MNLNVSGDFHIGDRVVFPKHRGGVLEEVGGRPRGQQVLKYYLVNIKSSNLKVTVPFHSVGAVGLRRVVRNGEIQKILDYLSDGNGDSATDWKDRFKENSDRMRTGSLLEVAAVLKSLLVLKEAKGLSFREKKMLERARYLLVSELAMARNTEESNVEEILDKALSKTNLKFPDAAELQS
jgi:CarD family transcriptional regulator